MLLCSKNVRPTEWTAFSQKLTTDQKNAAYDEYVDRGPPGVLGIWGEAFFIFRELVSTANNFRGAGEQAHTFDGLGSTAKK